MFAKVVLFVSSGHPVTVFNGCSYSELNIMNNGRNYSRYNWVSTAGMLTQRTTDVDSVIMQYCDDGTLMTSVQTDNEHSYIPSIQLYWPVGTIIGR